MMLRAAPPLVSTLASTLAATLTVVLTVFLTGLTVFVCRFTVRDVGFVDLGDPTYTLYAYVSKDESPAAHAGVARLASALFAETNVRIAVVDPDGDGPADGPAAGSAAGDDDAHRVLRELKIQKFPTTVLVHPDGRALEIGFTGTFAETGGQTLESVVQSELRRAITDGVLRRYCVVVLIEGDDADENTRVTRAVEASFKEIERVFDRMPKAVGDLPGLIRIPRNRQDAEKVLMWSLGISPDANRREPSVAVLFGRGRRFGPVLDGDGITKDTVLAILANAGQSCECELDRSWMRGPRMPLRWDEDTRQKAAELLGFDPENPLVKSEISGILARGAKGQNDGPKEPTIADLLGSYTEATVEGVTNPGENADGTANRGVARSVAERAPANVATTTPERKEGEENPVLGWRTLLWTLGALLGLSLIAAAIVFVRAGRS